MIFVQQVVGGLPLVQIGELDRYSKEFCWLFLHARIHLGRKLANSGAPFNMVTFSVFCTVSRQCPGTTIERNFEVGTSLSVSLVVNGSTALIPSCGRSSSTSSSSASPASTTSCQQHSTSTGAGGAAARGRRLRVAGEGTRYPSSPLSSAANHRLLQEEGDQSTNTTLELPARDGESWAWDEDGPAFGLGELSRIRLSSHALLLDDGGGEAWAPLRNTSSAAATIPNSGEEDDARAGVITALLDSFGVQEAVFSAMLSFSRVEAVEESSRGGGGVLGDSK